MSEINQYEFEDAINRILAFGDESYLANCVGKSPSYYSQQLNPHDPRESIWYRAARDFHNLIELDPERGCAALDLFNYFAKRSLPGDASLCVKTQRERAYQERTELHLAEASNKPLDDRIRELSESVEADQKLLAALRAEVRRDAQIEVNVREFAQNAVGKRNGRAK